MPPVKILHLLPSNCFSGAEHVILQIMDLFRNDPYYEMWYVCSEGPIRFILQKRGVRYKLVPAFSKKEVAKVLQDINPDIIHAHDFRASVMAARIGRSAKIISHLHNNWPWIKKINMRTLVYAAALHRIRLVLGVSRSIRDEYIFRICMKGKFFVLPNVLDGRGIYQKAEEFTVEKPLDLLFVGRLTEQKNPILFLEIFEILVKKGYHLQGVLLGDGELKNICEEYIAQHHLQQHIILKGFVDNPYPYIKAAKVLVIPSCWEGFGLVAVEAMLLKTPVIGCPVGGLKNILERGGGCLAQTKEEFVLAIEKLLRDNPYYNQMVHAGLQCASVYTDLEIYKNRLIGFYEKARGS